MHSIIEYQLQRSLIPDSLSMIPKGRWATIAKHTFMYYYQESEVSNKFTLVFISVGFDKYIIHFLHFYSHTDQSHCPIYIKGFPYTRFFFLYNPYLYCSQVCRFRMRDSWSCTVVYGLYRPLLFI